MTMKKKNYTDVFVQAKEHPKAKAFLGESKARIKLAEALHRERSSQKLSMAQLAEKAGTTPAVISRIEHAQVSAGLDVICKLFSALGKKELHLMLN